MLRYLNLRLPRRFGGRSVVVPLIGGFKVGLSGERFLLDLMDHFLPCIPGTVVDIGANVGQTLVKAKLAAPGRTYYGFEPNPACFHYLEALVQANGWGGVTLFPCGLGESARLEWLHSAPDRVADSRGTVRPPRDTHTGNMAKRPVCIFSVEDVQALIPEPVGFLKIDVEGAETEIVEGFAQRLARDRPAVVLEMLPDEEMQSRHLRTVSALRSVDYFLFRIDKRPDKGLARLMPVRDITEPASASDTDYLALHESRLDLLPTLEL